MHNKIDETRNQSIALIGAGISNLTALFYLLRSASPRLQKIEVFDCAMKVGGALQTEQLDGCRLEMGAQGVLASRENFRGLVKDLGLEERLLASGSGLSRFLAQTSEESEKSKPELLKLSPGLLLNPWSGFLGLRGVARLFLEPLLPKPSKKTRDNESVYAFIRRRFGAGLADRMASPITTGVWGGGEKSILLKRAFPALHKLEDAYGSIMMGLLIKAVKGLFSSKLKPKWNTSLKGLLSFDQGMGVLVFYLRKQCDKLASDQGITLKWKLGQKVTAITLGQHRFVLQTESKASIKTEEVFDAVLMSNKPWQIAITNLNALPVGTVERWNRIQKLKTHDLTCVGIVADESSVEYRNRFPRSFGVLSNAQFDNLLGVLFVHDIFPGHLAKDKLAFRVLLGGDRKGEWAHSDTEQLKKLAYHELANLGIGIDPLKSSSLVFQWHRGVLLESQEAIELLATFGELERLFEGLYFTGNYLEGVSVENAIGLGRKKAESILESFSV